MKEDDDHVEELMSRALDGELAAEEEASFRAHLAGCERCAAEFAALEGAVVALRGRGSEVLDGAAVTAIVDGAMPVGAGPGASSDQARHGDWRRPVLILSHAAALLAGLLLAWQLGGDGAAEPTAPTERIVRVEVPVEVPVETIREVPVEVVVIERVEVPVDRIVRETVVQTVPSPLQPRLDEALALANTFGALASTGASAIEGALGERSARIAAASGGAQSGTIASSPTTGTVPGRPPFSAASRRSTADAGDIALAASGVGAIDDFPHPRMSADGRASLVIRRDGGRVHLFTRGSVDEVVPALIDALDSGEPAVAAAARDRLEALRAELDGTPRGAPRALLTSNERSEDVPIDRAGGIRGLLNASRERRAGGPPVVDPDGEPGSDLWRAWWDGRSR